MDFLVFWRGDVRRRVLFERLSLVVLGVIMCVLIVLVVLVTSLVVLVSFVVAIIIVVIPFPLWFVVSVWSFPTVDWVMSFEPTDFTWFCWSWSSRAIFLVSITIRRVGV